MAHHQINIIILIHLVNLEHQLVGKIQNIEKQGLVQHLKMFGQNQ